MGCLHRFFCLFDILLEEEMNCPNCNTEMRRILNDPNHTQCEECGLRYLDGRYYRTNKQQVLDVETLEIVRL